MTHTLHSYSPWHGFPRDAVGDADLGGVIVVQYGDDDYPLPYFENRKGQQPPHEAISLQDYRQRYACYRMDAALQKLHARFPMIAIW